MAPRFSLSRSVANGKATVVVTGRIDPNAAAKLGYALVAAVSGRGISHVVVDLASVDSMDKSGLEALVLGHRAAIQHGCIVQIASPSPSVINAAIAGLRATDTLREHVQDTALRLLSANTSSPVAPTTHIDLSTPEQSP
jgi:anti-anti-sigma factor